MSKKSNVHPDHYKTAGRDRPDDAARARLNRAIAAKVPSRERPDRMGKQFYFEKPEPTRPEAAEAAPEPVAKKKPAARTARKRPRAKAAPARRAASATAKRKPASPARPAKKR